MPRNRYSTAPTPDRLSKDVLLDLVIAAASGKDVMPLLTAWNERMRQLETQATRPAKP